MVNSLENIDKSKVYVDRIEGLDEVVSDVISDTLTGAVSTITTSDLTASKILVSDTNGKVAASNISSSSIPDDSNLVHKTGNETIAGTKTFTSSMITDNIGPKGDITLGTSTNTWGKMIQFQDTTGKRIARIQPMAIDTTNNRVGMWVNNADNTTEKGIYIDSDGTTSAPTPSAGDNSTKIATTAFVKAQGYAVDSNVVHKTDNETISGIKTFNNIQKLNGNTLKCFNFAKGTNPSSTQYAQYYLTDNTETNGDNTALGRFRTMVDSNGLVTTSMTSFKNTTGTRSSSSISIYYPANGNPYTSCPASDFPGSIVTTDNYTKAANGYFKLGNGMIVQWGSYTYGDSSTHTITFPKSFSSTDYSISFGHQLKESKTCDFYGPQITNGTKSTTSCTVFTRNASTARSANVMWIAIGY